MTSENRWHLADFVGHLVPFLESPFWSFMIVHADEVVEKLAGIFCEILNIYAHWSAWIKSLKIENFVIWGIYGANAFSLEEFLGNLHVIPESL
jgi:hypothetical protein